jgi:hypothetical protein
VRGGQDTLQGALARIGSLPLSAVEARQGVAEDILQRAADSGAHLLRTRDLICHDGQCTVWSPSGQMYYDNNHLTVAASKQIRGVFAPVVTP